MAFARLGPILTPFDKEKLSVVVPIHRIAAEEDGERASGDALGHVTTESVALARCHTQTAEAVAERVGYEAARPNFNCEQNRLSSTVLDERFKRDVASSLASRSDGNVFFGWASQLKRGHLLGRA